jgi:hypothetical protein
VTSPARPSPDPEPPSTRARLLVSLADEDGRTPVCLVGLARFVGGSAHGERSRSMVELIAVRVAV